MTSLPEEPNETAHRDWFHCVETVKCVVDDRLKLCASQNGWATGLAIFETRLLEMFPVDPNCLWVEAQKSSNRIKRYLLLEIAFFTCSAAGPHNHLTCSAAALKEMVVARISRKVSMLGNTQQN
jgi:hypothetical protein